MDKASSKDRLVYDAELVQQLVAKLQACISKSHALKAEKRTLEADILKLPAVRGGLPLGFTSGTPAVASSPPPEPPVSAIRFHSKLKDHHNYHLWNAELKWRLKQYRLTEFVINDDIDFIESQRAIKAWAIEQAKTILMDSLHKSIWNSVLLLKMDSWDTYKAIESGFKSADNVVRCDLMGDFMDLSTTNFVTITDFNTTFLDLWMQLDTVGDCISPATAAIMYLVKVEQQQRMFVKHVGNDFKVETEYDLRVLLDRSNEWDVSEKEPRVKALKVDSRARALQRRYDDARKQDGDAMSATSSRDLRSFDRSDPKDENMVGCGYCRGAHNTEDCWNVFPHKRPIYERTPRPYTQGRQDDRDGSPSHDAHAFRERRQAKRFH